MKAGSLAIGAGAMKPTRADNGTLSQHGSVLFL
jgi:hypothetical protein